MAGAPKGNKNAMKLKTPELRKEAYESYCAHIASGESKEAWVFEHPEIKLTSETMEKYISNDPIEFDPIHKSIAQAKSFLHWCTLGKNMMLGKVEKCQPAIFQMFMRNKFGWDKETHQEVTSCSADKILEKIDEASPKI